MKSLQAVVIDPSFNTMYYDYHFLKGLIKHVERVYFFKSKLITGDREIIPDGVIARDKFFFVYNNLLSDFIKNKFLRVGIRLSEYPIDLVNLFNTLFFLKLKNRKTVVHFEWCYNPFVDVFFMKLLQQLLKLPVVYTIHNILPHKRFKGDRFIYGMVYETADALIVHEEANRSELLTIFPNLEKKVSVIPHGVLFENVEMMGQDEAKKRLGIPENKKVILYLGNISPYKGVSDFITAMGILKKKRDDFIVVIAGNPFIKREEIEKWINDAGIDAITRKYFRFIKTEEMPIFFGAADFVCLPHRRITQSGVLLSAIRFEVPVVTTDAGGFKTVLENHKIGLMARAGDAESFASACDKMLNFDKKVLEGFREEERKLKKGKYNWDNIGRATARLYETLV